MRRLTLLLLLAGILALILVGCGGNNGNGPDEVSPSAYVGNMVVFAFNELGMHCMNKNFSKLMILPPFNTVRAQVIRRGEDPQIVRSGVVVSYNVPGNTRSTGKTNFWSFAAQLFGFALKPNVGLAGNKLTGNMRVRADGRYEAAGLPITPLKDSGQLDPYQLATVNVKSAGTLTASTQAVVPVSWEISCNLCHKGPEGADVNILKAHDRRHRTTLASQTPVACGRCHQQPPLVEALGPGSPALPTLSRAMHNSHASRMAGLNLGVSCYACHPGVKTQCQRDVHLAKGMTCQSCHGSMTAVSSPTRKPWVDEPRCGSCHVRSGFQFEEPGKLFKESRGHNGVFCTSCHNTPHAIVPTTTAADNVQNTNLQGHAGTIDKCTLCHVNQPDEAFNHTLSD